MFDYFACNTPKLLQTAINRAWLVGYVELRVLYNSFFLILFFISKYRIKTEQSQLSNSIEIFAIQHSGLLFKSLDNQNTTATTTLCEQNKQRSPTRAHNNLTISKIKMNLVKLLWLQSMEPRIQRLRSNEIPMV